MVCNFHGFEFKNNLHLMTLPTSNQLPLNCNTLNSKNKFSNCYFLTIEL
jgi:hypothetical protein